MEPGRIVEIETEKKYKGTSRYIPTGSVVKKLEGLAGVPLITMSYFPIP